MENFFFHFDTFPDNFLNLFHNTGPISYKRVIKSFEIKFEKWSSDAYSLTFQKKENQARERDLKYQVKWVIMNEYEYEYF